VRRFAFDVEVLMRAARRGATIEAIPTEWAHREESRVAPLSDGARMLWDAVRLAGRARRTPLDVTGSPGDMSPATFDVMHRVEREHWWFRAKRDIVRSAIVAEATRGVAVDVGCGTGAVLHDLAGLGFAPVLGTDLDAHALTLVAGDVGPGIGLARAVAEALPLRSGSVQVLCSLDVVEHLDDDVLALREYLRVLRPGGRLVVTVPAYRWAWSSHDVDLGHRRRYTRPQLESVAAAAGFEIVTSRYFHAWLVPIALLLRKTPLRAVVADKPAESVSMGGPLQNAIGHRLAALDRRLALPFGLSILLVARRPGQ
jgi:SAM-dependent methyltransferase